MKTRCQCWSRTSFSVRTTYEKVVTGLPYIIAYALSEERSGEERLTVLRIIHGARHWPKDEWPGES
jgi:plasmid stabilization system protein ParE